MKLKYAIRGLSRRFFYSFLIILQLTFGFYCIYENINLNKDINTETNKVQHFFKGKKAYTLEVKNVSEKADFSSLKKAVEDLEKSNKYTFLKNNLICNRVKVFDGYNSFEKYNHKWTVDNATYFLAKNIIINENYLKTYPVKLKEGRLFNKEEFNFQCKKKDEIPIVVGANYGKYFKVGDKIDIRLSHKCKAKIIGILEKDQLSPGDIRLVNKRYINLNDYIITTDLNYTSKFDMYAAGLLGGNYILFDEDTDISKINSTLKEIKDRFNNIKGVSDENIRDLASYMKQDRDTLKEQRKIIVITCVSVIIFVCVTFIISLLESINKRKFEYGVHIMNGGTLKDIAIISYLEVFILFIASYALALTFIYRKYGRDINAENAAILFVIMVVISVIASIIPIMKIFKLDIDCIIKGEE